MVEVRAPEGQARAALGVAAAILLLYLALILPNHPEAMTPGAFGVFPLELPAIVAVLVLTGGRWAQVARGALAGFLTLMVVVKLADYATNVAFLRDFNPALDMHLLPAGWRLLSGSAGAPLALVLLIAALAGLVAVAAGLWWATGRIARLRVPASAPTVAVAVVAVSLLAVDRLRPAAIDPPGISFTTRLAWEHVREANRARADLAGFRLAAMQDPFADAADAGLLAGLHGQDVALLFVESYGRSALDNPIYAATIEARLEGIDAEIKAAGLAVRSAFLTSPVAGGQSWLAHATLLSGLWIDNQGRYEALVASPRRTLLHLARDAGWRTAAVMPGITLDWPDATYFGYDRVLAAKDLGYRGPPFGWVTMPDQFTLAAMERLLLSQEPRRPVFAEVALISSHAPWTPLADIVPWAEIGDGRGFARFLGDDDQPGLDWRDMASVRALYLRAVDYTLEVAGSFAARQAGSGPLIVLLGDHQPASPISQAPENRDVPIHVIGPPGTLAALDEWAWTPAMLPAPDAPVWRMDAFRNRFLSAFSQHVGTDAEHVELGRDIPSPRRQ